MLSDEHRLTDGELFRQAARRGARCGRPTLVAHLLVPTSGTGSSGTEPPRIGFVVSRAVGNAVVRNRVKRRLRHLAREHVSSLPGAAVLVVRALPAAGTARADLLGADLAHCLDKLTGRASYAGQRVEPAAGGAAR